MSSNVVALVEYDPWAEELRLWVGEGMLSWPSEKRWPRELDKIDLLSPVPFSRLGLCELNVLPLVLELVLDGRFERGPVERGVKLEASEGRFLLGIAGLSDDAVVGREPGLINADGGWGKAAMLITLRIVFSAASLVFALEDTERRLARVGTAGVEAEICGVGSAVGRGEIEGPRILEGTEELDGVLDSVPDGTGRLFLGLLEVFGIAGNGEDGGSIEG